MNIGLIHGWAMHGGLWGPLVPQLETLAEVQLLELPGHGHEPMIEGEYSLASLAHHAAGQLQPGSIVIGWSLGAMVAMQLALQFPQQVRALILISSTPRFVNLDQVDSWSHGIRHEVLQGFAHELEQGVERALGRFLALQLGNDSSAEQLRELRQLVKSRPVPTVEVMRIGLQLLATADLRSRVAELKLPVLLIQGARDRLMPVSAANWLAQQLPGADLTIIDKAGHAPFLSHTQEVVAGITALLHRMNEEVV